MVGVSQQILAYPTTSAVGGNTGEVNSFAGINIGDLTGGAGTALTEFAKDPKKMGCFISQALLSSTPTFLSNFAPAQRAIMQNALTKNLMPTLTNSFGSCPDFAQGKDINTYGNQFPGLTADLDDASRANSPRP